MRPIALCLALLLASPSVLGPANAATTASGRGGGSTSGGHATPPAGAPHTGVVRPGVPGLGIGGRGLPGSGLRPDGIGRLGERGEFRGERGEFRRERGRFGGGTFVGVPAFVPVPDLLGLPYYDGFQYPYFYPGSAALYITPDLYTLPPDYVPPAATYAPPNYPPPPNQAPSQQIWYYCQDPMGYYPYVRDCNGPWQAVPASVLPPPTPQ
jgi:hypothetical protein